MIDKENFSQTVQAVATLQAALSGLKETVVAKKKSLAEFEQTSGATLPSQETHSGETDKKIELMLTKVATAMAKIDMVLKDNGPDNNHD